MPEPATYPYAPPSAMLSFRLERQELESLRKAAAMLQASQAGIIRYAVETWLDQMVDHGGIDRMTQEQRASLAFQIGSPVRRKRAAQSA